jgi:phosphohistidine swiveling domain-containing protein
VKADWIPEIIDGLTKEFGYMPLVSVRSGAKFSMPGMMDTILNVGLKHSNEHWQEWLERLGVDCVCDSWNRLLEMYGSVVNGIPREKFNGKGWGERELFYKLEVGKEFPDVVQQLKGAIEAVFKSWNNERAKTYRKLNDIADDLGTAVVVQAMVFGNMNDKSCTGVLFSRDPSTGFNETRGEFLVNAQGEDVVAGTRTPEPLSGIMKWNEDIGCEILETVSKLEQEYRDMVDVEFTVQDGVLYILQCRVGKRTAQAAIKIAVDLVKEGVIDKSDVASRVTYKQYLAATRAVIDPEWKKQNPAHGKGIPASNGVAKGVAVFSSEAALKCKEPCILVAKETTPDDIEGMNAAVGILTATGGATSHAAVVARGMDKVCVVGCSDLEHAATGSWFVKTDQGAVSYVISESCSIVIDGETGEFWVHVDVPVINGAAKPEVRAFRKMVKDGFEGFEVVTHVDGVKGKKNVVLQTLALSVADVMKAVQEFDGELMVLDVRGKGQLLDDADRTFMSGFSYSLMFNYPVLKALEEFKGDKSKLVILGLAVEGYESVQAIENLTELLHVSGLCMPDFDKLCAELGGSENVKKIVKLRREAGEVLRSFNILSYRCEPAVFAKGAAVAVSEQVLLASLLAA